MENKNPYKSHTKNIPVVLIVLLAFSFMWLLGELFYFMIVFNKDFFADRIFIFQKPDHLNYYLVSYIMFSLLLRTFGLLNISRSKKAGLREFAFGQLMAIAIVIRAIIKLVIYISLASEPASASFNEMATLITLLLLESLVLVCFYLFRKHPNQYNRKPGNAIILFTSISLIGCFLNILNIIHDIYLLSNKDYLAEYCYLLMLCVATFFSTYGLFLMRDGDKKGFASYFTGQVIELIFYIAVLFIFTIPGYSTHADFDNSIANLGFFKNSIPVVLMTVMFFFLRKTFKINENLQTSIPAEGDYSQQ